MKLKYIITCDEFGFKTEPDLHYWNKDTERWELVLTEECKDKNYENFVKEKIYNKGGEY